MTSAGALPTAGTAGTVGEWGVLLLTSAIPVRELARAQVPDESVVYLLHNGQAAWLGGRSLIRFSF